MRTNSASAPSPASAPMPADRQPRTVATASTIVTASTASTSAPRNAAEIAGKAMFSVVMQGAWGSLVSPCSGMLAWRLERAPSLRTLAGGAAERCVLDETGRQTGNSVCQRFHNWGSGSGLPVNESFQDGQRAFQLKRSLLFAWLIGGGLLINTLVSAWLA